MYYYPKLRSIFVSNPKTGTKFILKTLNPYLGSRRARKALLEPGISTLGVEHPTAQQSLGFVREGVWERHFTFSVVRNPWDRLLSVYAYGMSNKPRHPQNWTFEQVIRWACDPNDLSRKPWLRVKESQYRTLVGGDGKCLVDVVLRTEQLTEEMQKMAEDRWGISLEPGEKKNTSTHKTRQEMYSPELRELVAQRFHRDIELFGYCFEDTSLPPVCLSRGSRLLPEGV